MPLSSKMNSIENQLQRSIVELVCRLGARKNEATLFESFAEQAVAGAM